MKAISIRQPWAWAIFHDKNVENRDWAPKYRGPLLIHAAKTFDWKAYRHLHKIKYDPFYRGNSELWRFLKSLPFSHERNLKAESEIPHDFKLGGIIGRVDLVNIITDSTSPWAEPGKNHWIFENAQPLPFHPCRGMPGLFDVDLEV